MKEKRYIQVSNAKEKTHLIINIQSKMKYRKVEEVTSGLGSSERGEVKGEGEGRQLWWTYFVLCMKTEQ
jgi:hypothetical protein